MIRNESENQIQKKKKKKSEKKKAHFKRVSKRERYEVKWLLFPIVLITMAILIHLDRVNDGQETIIVADFFRFVLFCFVPFLFLRICVNSQHIPQFSANLVQKALWISRIQIA